MSERSAALGVHGPAKTIEHKGKTYSIAPVLTEGTLLAVEAKMYARDKAALLDLRDAYPTDEYLKRLDELRAKHESGYYSFESQHTLDFLQTKAGAVVLLSCMMSADAGEILDLMAAKAGELEQILNEVMADSFPDAPPPKAEAPRRRGRG